MKKILSWVVGAIIVASVVYAAQQTVVSTDTFNQAFTKTNANDTELYGKWTTLGSAYDTSAELDALFGGKQDADPFLADIAALTDPNADRLLFWDDSVGDLVFLTLGTNLSITGATLNATGGSATVEDTAYGATWNGDTDGTSKNTIYDYLVNFDADADGDYTDEAWFPSTTGAPTSATYLTTTAEAGLSAETVVSANGLSLVTAVDYAAMRVLLDLEIGTDLQAWSTHLDTLSSDMAANAGKITGSYVADDSISAGKMDSTNAPVDGYFPSYDSTSGGVTWEPGSGGSMVYPGAGIPNSTGSAWGASYTITTLMQDLDDEIWVFANPITVPGITVPQTATPAFVRFWEGSGDGTHSHYLHGQAFSQDWNSYLPDYQIGFLKSDQVSSTGGMELNTIGSFSTPVTATPYTLTATNSYNAQLFYGATGEVDLPALADGMAIVIYNTGAFTITVDPNGTEIIIRDGTAQAGGVSMTLNSGAGNFVCLFSDGARWVTLGYKGTLAEGS